MSSLYAKEPKDVKPADVADLLMSEAGYYNELAIETYNNGQDKKKLTKRWVD